MSHTDIHNANALEPDLFAGLIDLSLETSSNESRRKAIPIENHHDDKSDEAFKTISETAKMLALPQHVLRFWESKFTQIKPLKLKGGRRYYRPQDIEVLLTIKHLLYKQGYTIKGARKAFHQIKRQKDQPVMAQSIPPKKNRTSQPLFEDTPLFQSLMGNAPQSALLQAAMQPKVQVAPVIETKPRAEVEQPALKPLPLLETPPVVPKPSAPVSAAPIQHTAAPVATASMETNAASEARKKELQSIHGELLELRKLINTLPQLSSTPA